MKNRFTAFISILILLLTAGTASFASGPTPPPGVQQSGAVTPGHCTEWLGNLTVTDAGAPCSSGGGVSSITGDGTYITNSGSTGAVTLTTTFGTAAQATLGTAGNTVPRNNTNNIFSGTHAITGTSLPAQGSGTLGLAGTAAIPTLGATAEGDAWLSAADGFNIIGDGSTNDFRLWNKSGSSVCTIATGTTNFNCTGLQVGGVAVSTATGANPTGTAGPAAVNGSATTFMRSDAAPAVQKASAAQFGIIEGDGATTTLTAGVLSCTTGTTGQLGCLKPDGTTITVSSGTITAVGTVIQNTLSGFQTSNLTGTNTTATATIGAGQAADSSNAIYISNSSTESWSVSNGNAINGYSGGTTLPNSSTIHMLQCQGTSGVGAYAIPNSSYAGFTAASCPTGYTSHFRRVFSFNTGSGGSPIPFTPVQIAANTYVYWLTTSTFDINTSSLGSSSRTLFTLNVPLGIKVMPQMEFSSSTSSMTFRVSSGDEPDQAITANNNAGSIGGAVAQQVSVTSSPTSMGMGSSRVYTTNTSGQIGIRAFSGTSNVFEETTDGWIDPHNM